MSFKDIFKKSFLEGFSGSEIDLITIVAALGIASILAFYIFLVYRVVTRKTFYSKSFNLSLAGITVITVHTLSLTSFGIDYGMYLDAYRAEDAKDIYVRFPWWKMITRPGSISLNKVRQSRMGE